MWPANFWQPRFWERRFWPKTGAVVGPPPTPPPVPPPPFTIPGVYQPTPIYDWTSFLASRVIKAVSYNGSTSAMVVSFPNGTQATFSGVGSAIAEGLRGAGDPDKFLVENVLGKYVQS